MEPGNLVRYERFPGEVNFGYIMYLDTDYGQDVFCHIRWDDGTETDEYECTFYDGIIKVIQ